VQNEAELAVLRSLFEVERIPFLVHNDTIGSILAGPLIENYNTRSFMVSAEDAERARELVRRFITDTDGSRPVTPIRDRVRMVLEAMLFSWFAPGRSHRAVGSHEIDKWKR